jgi:hypothetical protein
MISACLVHSFIPVMEVVYFSEIFGELLHEYTASQYMVLGKVVPMLN